jgi:hypothetical protein
LKGDCFSKPAEVSLKQIDSLLVLSSQMMEALFAASGEMEVDGLGVEEDVVESGLIVCG